MGAIVFLLLYLANRLYPLHPDDWEYMYMYSVNSDATQRISSLADIFKSQYDHYFLWGGRVVVHSIAQLLLMLDKGWINIINSFVFVGFVFLIYSYTKRKDKTDYWLFAFYFFALWLFVPSFFSVALWITGAANYLWGNFIVLLCMYPLYRYYRYSNNSRKRRLLYIMPLVGLLAGWCNENASAALLAFYCMVFILLKIEKRRIPVWAILTLVFVLLGFVLMIKAPGNVNRFVLADRGIAELNLFDSEILKERIRALSFHFYYSWVIQLLLGYIITACVFFWQVNTLLDEKLKTQVLKVSFLFFLTATASFVVMVGSPSIPERSLFITNTLIIMSIGVLLASIDFNSNKIRQVARVLCMVVLLVLFCRDYYKKYITLEMIDAFWQEREVIVRSEKAKGNLDIVFTSSIQVDYKYSVGQELSIGEDSMAWTNKRYARYKGLNSVVQKGDSIFNYKYLGIPQY